MSIDIQYYSEEVDKILLDILGPSLVFDDPDKPALICMIVDTIRCYDRRLCRKDLAIIIQYLIQQKYMMKQTYVEVSEPVSNTTHYLEKRYDQARLNKVKRIRELKAIPQHEQKSEGWLKQRQTCLTATAIAIVIDEDPYKYPAELLLDKCGLGEPFTDNENVHHGRKYEEIANMYYAHVNDVCVAEYGLIQHETHPFIGASPDGICERKRLYGPGLSKLVGRLLEIKCPYRRQIKSQGNLDGDICPHYYYVQVQVQLFVTCMDECDFLQVTIKEYDDWTSYKEDTGLKPWLTKSGFNKGCVIQLAPIDIPNGDARTFGSQYIYPPRFEMTPKEIKKWIASSVINYPNHRYAKTHTIDKVIYWRFERLSCNLITYEKEWFESKIPMIKQFWDYVEFYKANPNKLQALHEYIKETGVKESKKIFKRIHKEYGVYDKPLYEEPTEWRKKYTALKARWAK